jgi:hypothetical protein
MSSFVIGAVQILIFTSKHAILMIDSLLDMSSGPLSGAEPVSIRPDLFTPKPVSQV